VLGWYVRAYRSRAGYLRTNQGWIKFMSRRRRYVICCHLGVRPHSGTHGAVERFHLLSDSKIKLDRGSKRSKERIICVHLENMLTVIPRE
jgi:hypothetical protein